MHRSIYYKMQNTISKVIGAGVAMFLLTQCTLDTTLT